LARVPLLAGSRIATVEVPEGALVLRPPPPREAIDDVAAAVREALRFPLAGEPLERLASRGGRATVVIEQPGLPIPWSVDDPRHDAIAATVDELGQHGVADVTILVAGGLQRRSTPREIGLLVRPEFRRRFRGRVAVHDVEAGDLVELGLAGPSLVPLRVNRALVETDLIVTVTAAETVVSGGPGALLGACGREALRAATVVSLLETSRSRGWQLAVELERLLLRRVPVSGVSLALNLPRVFGGYPYDEAAVDRIARSRTRRGLGLLPGPVRRRMIERVPRSSTVAAVFGGTPSAAHAEALVRATAFKGTEVEEQLDAVVIGVPETTPFFPRETPNPVSAAYLGLGLALRLWRNAFPIRRGGSAILLHPLRRRFSAPSQTPFRALFADPGRSRDEVALGELERACLANERALDLYRSGRALHPLRPFLEWEACRDTAARLSSVLVAGCRDAQSARQLGFVPAHGLSAALAMARGTGAERIGYLLSPPYFPLLVGPPAD
jgi:Lactate racemase N-terminal domain